MGSRHLGGSRPPRAIRQDPAQDALADHGSGSNFYDPGSQGDLWTSSPISDFSYNAWDLFSSSSYFEGRNSSRYRGQPVRPVRDPDE